MCFFENNKMRAWRKVTLNLNSSIKSTRYLHWIGKPSSNISVDWMQGAEQDRDRIMPSSLASPSTDVPYLWTTMRSAVIWKDPEFQIVWIVLWVQLSTF